MVLFRKRKKQKDEPKKTGAERRRWPRIKLDARVVVSYPNMEKLISGPISDISNGGLFIRTVGVRPVGTRVTLKIQITRETLEFVARGRVMRVVGQEQSRDTGAPMGMGIAFESLDEEAREAIDKIIAAAHEMPEGHS